MNTYQPPQAPFYHDNMDHLMKMIQNMIANAPPDHQAILMLYVVEQTVGLFTEEFWKELITQDGNPSDMVTDMSPEDFSKYFHCQIASLQVFRNVYIQLYEQMKAHRENKQSKVRNEISKALGVPVSQIIPIPLGTLNGHEELSPFSQDPLA